MKKLLFILLLINIVYAQKKDPDVILQNVMDNFNRIKDYEVDVKIKVDVDFIKVPDMNAKLFFEQPDKMHLDSEGFAMLPRGGMNFSPASLLSGDHTAFFEKDETLPDGTEAAIVKVIPLGGEGEVVLSTLWIDTEKNRIRKVETSTKTQGTYSIELKYDKVMEYPLPSEMIFSFNVDRMDLPKGMGGDLNTETKKERKEKTTKGKVFVSYSGYKINEGIPDDIFKEDEK